MKSQNKTTGKIGEDVACAYLKDHGYQIVERNWGNKWGEIDIIAHDRETIVFVEVKTKIGIKFGIPEEMVNKRKLNQIMRIAYTYPLVNNSAVRIDVVAIVLHTDLATDSINHYKAVY